MTVLITPRRTAVDGPIGQQTTAVLLTDLDNTLLNWIDYFAPSFRAMVRALVVLTGEPEDELYTQFRDVYVRRHAAEYPRAIEEIDLCRNAPADIRSKIVYTGLRAFHEARRRNLRCYPYVPETLRALKNEGVAIVGVTNAALNDALGRLRYLGLSQYFSSLVGWYGVHLQQRRAAWLRRSGTGPACLPLRSCNLKPDPTGFRLALDSLSVEAAQVVAIGDSIANDLVPASAIGAVTVWARYGKQFSSENYDTICRISCFSADKIAAMYAADRFQPDVAIDDFRDLFEICSTRAAAKSGQ